MLSIVVLPILDVSIKNLNFEVTVNISCSGLMQRKPFNVKWAVFSHHDNQLFTSGELAQMRGQWRGNKKYLSSVAKIRDATLPISFNQYLPIPSPKTDTSITQKNSKICSVNVNHYVSTSRTNDSTFWMGCCYRQRRTQRGIIKGLKHNQSKHKNWWEII